MCFVLFCIFSADMMVNFFLAYRETEQRRTVTDLARIRSRYLRWEVVVKMILN